MNERTPAMVVEDDAELFRLLVQSIQDYSIFIISPEGRIVTWNAGARRTKGYEENEIIGEPYERFFLPEDRLAGKPSRLLREAQRVGHVHDEGWRLRKDGSRFWAAATLTALYDQKNGSLRAFAKVTHDETAKHAAEEQLRHSEERFRLSVGALREQAFYMLSPKGIVENWNPGAQLIKGYSEAEVLGKHFDIFFTAEDRANGKPMRELELAMANGSYEEEGWRVRKDGSRFWAAVIVTAVYDYEGTLRGFTKVTRNETERHEATIALNEALARARDAERELREHAEKLERRVDERTELLSQQTAQLSRTNAELGQFAYIASHDLKEPLRMITSYLDLVRTRHSQAFAPPAGPYLSKVEAAAKRMSEMVEAVLEYSYSSSINERFAEVVLSDVAAHAINNLQAAIADSGASVQVNELPTVQGSAPHLARVFQNLIGNALKFRSQRPVQVTIDAQPGPKEWTIAVRDNGIGIDPAHHHKIFRIFQRLHNKQEYSGSGIGLAACKKIVESHGGRIWVESSPGSGSTFLFTVPLLT